MYQHIVLTKRYVALPPRQQPYLDFFCQLSELRPFAVIFFNTTLPHRISTPLVSKQARKRVLPIISRKESGYWPSTLAAMLWQALNS